MYVFFIGVPCSGKSTALGILRKLIQMEESVSIREVDDFRELARIFAEDREFRRHVPREDGGVEIVDPSVWQQLDAFLNGTLTDSLGSDTLVLIEFARNRYVPTFKRLDARITDGAVLAYIYCLWDIAWGRNLPRRHAQPARYISKAQMESTFASDDYDALSEWARGRLITIENDTGDLGTLEQEVRLKLLPRVRALLGLSAN